MALEPRQQLQSQAAPVQAVSLEPCACHGVNRQPELLSALNIKRDGEPGRELRCFEENESCNGFRTQESQPWPVASRRLGWDSGCLELGSVLSSFLKAALQGHSSHRGYVEKREGVSALS